MTRNRAPSALRILVPVGLGTCLSLAGDASLYAVLPTHADAAGVTVAAVGILLSANRIVRLVLNGPAGVAYGRYSRRRLFVAALLIGAFSTAVYALTRGFWPLLAGRLLWGLAWAGIWIGGNTIMAEVSDEGARGRWVGLYHGFFFLGAAGGPFLGGLLTDGIGYHGAMGVAAGLTLVGAFIALACLPDVERADPFPSARARGLRRAIRDLGPGAAAAVALHGVNRLVVSGVLTSTLGLLLQEEVGRHLQIAGRAVGVATLTGSGLGLSTLLGMASAPMLGALSDRVGNRWNVVAGGLAPGVAGFALLALGAPWSILAGIPLTAIASGGNMSLSTTLIGDLCEAAQESGQLGVLFTVGDLASAIGPPVAYALMPLVGIRGNYLLSAGVLASMLCVALWLGSR
ncbi:MAG: MFS transporter [Chloroflexota bacterium]|nr:MFS transporter [Chloroflexota bacterium]